MAIRVLVLDGVGPKDYENTLDSFFATNKEIGILTNCCGSLLYLDTPLHKPVPANFILPAIFVMSKRQKVLCFVTSHKFAL